MYIASVDVKIAIRNDAKSIPNKCSCCWPLFWHASNFDQVFEGMSTFCDLFRVGAIFLRYQTKIVSHESILYQIDFSILLLHMCTCLGDRKEKDDYNFDVQHQERRLVSNLITTTIYVDSALTGSAVATSSRKKATCGQAIKIYSTDTSVH